MGAAHAGHTHGLNLMRVTADLESSIMFNKFTSADKVSVLKPALNLARTR